MDDEYRQAERNNNYQKMYRLLKQQGHSDAAIQVALRGSINVDAALEYWYQFQYIRQSGSVYSPKSWSQPTREKLIVQVAKNIKPSYIKNYQELVPGYKKIIRGRYLRVPILLWEDITFDVPGNDMLLSRTELNRFMQEVAETRG